MPRLKVCGINDAAFAVEAARRGVDYLGLIFADQSPRRVTPDAAREIVEFVRGELSPARAEASPLPRFVGVFTTGDIQEMLDIARFARLDAVQLHGLDYTAGQIAALKSRGLETWVLHGRGLDAEQIADAVLLDGRDGARSGGTGKCADWSLVAPLKAAGRRVVLAGGISSKNIAGAIATGADVVDVNSSLETSPGCKSVALLDELLGML